MSDQDKKVMLTTEDGENVEFYVLEETKLGGIQYLMVTDAAEDDEEGECYILKDLSKPEDAQALYQFVEDDNELDYLFNIFSELLDDLDVDLRK